ncbi:VOC family protein [Edaphovirga cremea]|uniref:VOC family protein n=1 Tax=Edaphovirga cremea TaxID=2267246 RepID=UPI000DEF06F7|nr:VOC family protein [Edaphovirga cremea]
MESNIVGWFEIYVRDIARAKKFYETVFCTTLEKVENIDFDYWMFPWKEGREGSGGALVQMDGVWPGPGGTLNYFMCNDCAVEEARVAIHGGEVIRTKFSLGPNGFAAIVKDTEGNVIGLHSMK